MTPPMLHAAMPVLAVTATASLATLPNFLLRQWMIWRRSTDLPVPAELLSPEYQEGQTGALTGRTGEEDALPPHSELENALLLGT